MSKKAESPSLSSTQGRHMHIQNQCPWTIGKIQNMPFKWHLLAVRIYKENLL